MLLYLLLALALLGSPVSRAKVLYGHEAGEFFSTFDDYENEVRAIRITTNLLGQIQSIQVKIGCVWDATYGSLGRNMQEFHLSSGEHITAVHGKHLLKLWMLNVCTNHNHCVQFGKSVGKPFSAFPSEDGEVLQGFFGFLALNGFKNIGFKWGILPPESLPAPTCNNTLQ
ncbi:zymogen granule protein 16 homolog B-like [Ochotona curzoniae]|uniref:zymogen granule protein 16 homolog B-like n=1 Tax=Ochotona curzoniae TaxID=130825 RepID=UPI001B345829|nr:zymogen granule protein 16 homolog B-like [Ochotona curzoniae]XP_040853578.1 zymogen granule protein 16 homolog B-like [Ochotona curzoniae]